MLGKLLRTLQMLLAVQIHIILGGLGAPLLESAHGESQDSQMG